MNKQSNVYTIGYIIVIVVLVGTALALAATALRPRQLENANADKMKQILYSLHLDAEGKSVTKEFNNVVKEQLLVNAGGSIIKNVMTVSGDMSVFDTDVASEIRKPDSERKLPVFVATMSDGAVKYIIPVYGAGLWGPIWGYVAVDSDGSTIFGAYFSHAGETPGLGAEIEKPKFRDEFDGKHLFKGEKFLPIAVVKAGQVPANGEDYVDGVSGGTITSKGVGEMLSNCLTPYANFLSSVKN